MRTFALVAAFALVTGAALAHHGEGGGVVERLIDAIGAQFLGEPLPDQLLRRAGMQPGVAWCCAFTYWCFDEASRQTGQANPMFKTAGCLHHWQNAPGQGARRLLARDAVADPGRVQPGAIFIMDFGGGLGHTGLVERIEGGYIHTIEGNTDASQGREGGGVYRLQRKLASINKGFIDYAGV